MLPEARFIHIIRDPRSVAASLAAAGKDWGRSWASTSAVHNARRWVANVSEGIRLRREDPETYFEVRYEDLLDSTAPNLGRLFTWLGMAPSDDLCGRIAEQTQIKSLQQGTSTAAWDLAKEPQGFFRKGKADGWKEDLSLREIAFVEAIAGPLMEQLQNRRVPPGMSWRQQFEIRARAGLARRLTTLATKLQ
jgi:hypothetical protein